MTQHNRETLLSLADRFEKAAGESFDLFAESFDAIHGGRSSERLLWSQFCALIEAEAWLDAAMTLVPEGWEPIIDCRRTIEVQLETIAVDPETLDPRKVYATAATPALALCAASLRALTTLDPTGEKA